MDKMSKTKKSKNVIKGETEKLAVIKSMDELIVFIERDVADRILKQEISIWDENIERGLHGYGPNEPCQWGT